MPSESNMPSGPMTPVALHQGTSPVPNPRSVQAHPVSEGLTRKLLWAPPTRHVAGEEQKAHPPWQVPEWGWLLPPRFLLRAPPLPQEGAVEGPMVASTRL